MRLALSILFHFRLRCKIHSRARTQGSEEAVTPAAEVAPEIFVLRHVKPYKGTVSGENGDRKQKNIINSEENGVFQPYYQILPKEKARHKARLALIFFVFDYGVRSAVGIAPKARKRQSPRLRRLRRKSSFFKAIGIQRYVEP